MVSLSLSPPRTVELTLDLDIIVVIFLKLDTAFLVVVVQTELGVYCGQSLNVLVHTFKWALNFNDCLKKLINC